MAYFTFVEETGCSGKPDADEDGRGGGGGGIRVRVRVRFRVGWEGRVGAQLQGYDASVSIEVVFHRGGRLGRTTLQVRLVGITVLRRSWDEEHGTGAVICALKVLRKLGTGYFLDWNF